jgi:2,5-diamino-6-(ribosylamino)-4(3H)-pyrimidinone 5'-phosphate reductase
MKPHVILYNAVSVDGRTDGFQPDIELFYSLVARWHEDATIAGSDTLLQAAADIPDETEPAPPPAVDADDERPLLVVPDSRGRVRTWHYWRTQPYWRDCVVLCSERTPPEYVQYLADRQIKSIVAGDAHIDFALALEVLHTEHGVKVLRVDSGGTLNGVLLRAGLVDELHLLVHPALVGGAAARSFFRALTGVETDAPIALRFKGAEQQHDDLLLLSYDVLNPIRA